MKSFVHHSRSVVFALTVNISAGCFAQWTATSPPLLTAPTTGAVVGTGGPSLGALTVRGDQMSPATGNLIHTRVSGAFPGFWRAFRLNDEIGHIRTTNTFNEFHVRASQPNVGVNGNPGILWLENNSGDGMMIRANGAQLSVNGYALTLDGFVSIGNQVGLSAMPSRARLHMVHSTGWNQAFPWRNDMRNGALFTGNDDLGYVGHKYRLNAVGLELLDQSDLVITAGENDISESTRQRIRFLYTTTPSAGVTSGAASFDGLEFMQCWPESATEGFVGIGDWNAATVANGGVQVNPTERLDILDRTIRARRIVPDYNNNTLNKLLVIDDNGLFHWRDVSTLPGGGGGTDCDWDIGPGAQLTTAWNPLALAGCPNNVWNVGIGAASPTSKLTVHDLWPDNTAALDRGLDVRMDGDGFSMQGANIEVNNNFTNALNSEGLLAKVYNGSVRTTALSAYSRVFAGAGGATGVVHGTNSDALLEGAANAVFGGKFGATVFASAAAGTHEVYGTYGLTRVHSEVDESYGAFGEVNSSVAFGRIFGVAGRAFGDYDKTNGSRIGVYGEALRDQNSYAGYFSGDVGASGSINGSVFLPWSDDVLKENETPITDAGSVLDQIAPVTYTFNTAAYADLGLPGGLQSGVVAQNVQAVLPHLVHPVSHPARYDSTGAMIAPPRQFLTVNYDGLIPYLIAEQKQLRAELAAMQQALAACCVGVPTDGTLFQGQSSSTGTGSQDLSRLASEDMLTIAPNPFEERTTISYRAATAGRVMLRVSDGRGQHIDTLRDAMQEAGAYTYEWNTTNLAPGMYTVSLLMDGQLLVDRAVKVGR